jgi:lysophospholipase L1-like esterase
MRGRSAATGLRATGRGAWGWRAALLGVALLWGCGADHEASPRSPAATATATTPADARIVISAPQDGGRLRARFAADGRLRAQVRVRGSARPGALVFLAAGCRPRRCQARATAAGDGRWSADMTLKATPEAHFVAIDARADADASAPVSAVVTVELRAPAQPSASAGASVTRRPATRGVPIPRPRALPHDVLVIGDSLAIGMEDSLRAALPGWRVRSDARIGRPLAEGMRILAGQHDVPAIIALSLFTNDDPRATAALAQAVRTTTSRSGGCAVWSTIVRPPYNGVSYAAANEVLERLAFDPQVGPRLQLVDWRAAVAQTPGLIAGDGVHGTPTGYRARGQLYAGAIKACAGEG